MKVTTALKKELSQWFDTFWSTYLQGDIETWATFVRDDYRNIGGTEAEIWNSKQEIIEYTNTIMDQFLGTADIRNRQIEVIPYGDYLMVHEFTDLYVKIDGEWSFYAPFRMSSLMEKTETGWITFHQHGSYPDMKALEGEAFSIDALKAENIRLQEGIKARTLELEEKNRELEIETALERIRSRSMAMHGTNELSDVILVLFKQLELLGIVIDTCYIDIFDTDNQSFNLYIGTGTAIYPQQVSIPYSKHNFHVLNKKAREDNIKFYTFDENKKSKDIFFEHFYANAKGIDVPKERRALVAKGTGMTGSTVIGEHSGISMFNYNRITYSNEENDILKRVNTVFQQTYTRFLDLQKAEKQAKEAKIEAALERIRASTMAMHKSHELAGVVKRINRELLNLNIHLDTTQILTDITNDPQKGFNIWIAVDGMDYLHKFHFPYLDHAITESFYKNQEKQIAFYSEQVGEEEKNSYFKLVFKYSDFKTIPKERQKVVFDAPGWTRGIVFLNNSILILSRYKKEAFNEEETEIFVRIGKVFEQAYTRFLDLKKAEAQAREAQIEVALERVRSRSMAMHKSHELHEVIQVLFEQLEQLSFNIDAANFVLNFRDSEAFTLWAAVPGQLYPTKINMPFVDTPILNRFIEAKEQNLDFYADRFTFEEKNEFFEHFFNHVEGVTEERKHYMLNSPGYARSTVLLKTVALYILNYAGVPYSEAENSILKRFAHVFEQSYTRFLDLQRAENQVREAQIEAALERIRSRSMAMHQTSELSEVILVLFKQFELLGMGLDTCYIDIFDKNNEAFHIWIGAGTAIYPEQVTLPYFNHPIHQLNKNARQNGIDFFTFNEDKKSKDRYFKHFYPNAQGIEVPQERRDYITKGKGMAGAAALGKHSGITLFNYNGIIYSEEEIDILRRVNKVFQQTYTRFLDLQKAEAQTREAQIEASLERVRSKTMAMHSSQDVGNTMVLLFEELENLGIKANRNGIIILDEEEHGEIWTAKLNMNNEIELLAWNLDMNLHSLTKQVYKAWKNKSSGTVYPLIEDDLKAYYKALNKSTDIPVKFNLEIFPPREWCYTFNFNEGFIYLFTDKEMTQEHQQIPERFASVFGQTYRRYQDLKKAEAQAREAQIEAALERVRSQAMAMHHTDDLGKTIEVFYDQLDHLFDTSIVRCGGGLLNKENKNAELFSASRTTDGDIDTVKGLIDMQGHHLLDTSYQSWLEQKELYYVLKGNEIRNYYKYITNQVAIPKNKGEDELHFHFTMFEDGSFYVITEKQIHQDELEVFRRFTSVLSLTYRRFNDLNKAEIQARESQIEAAVERVRSRSMAMHKSNELRAVVSTIYNELRNLKVNFHVACIQLLMDDSKDIHLWIGSEDGVYKDLISWPYVDIRIMNEVYKARLNTSPIEILLTKTETKEFFEEYFKVDGIPKERKAATASVNLIDIVGYFQANTSVFIMRYSEGSYTEDEKMITERFSKVFEQTYTRFLDLQKAEAREREAVKQASLDRVRGEIASMRTAKDLERITPLVWKELTALGVPFFRCGVFIIREDEEMVHAYLSTPDGKSVAALHIPFSDDDNLLIKPAVNNWRNQRPYREEWNQEQFIQQTRSFMEKGQIENPKSYKVMDTPPERLVLHLVPFRQGMLYVGHSEDLNQEQLALVESLALTFSVAYSRYEDFKALEDTKNSLELTLKDLKSTQTQLIQAEKMASLGELTAGIAHEIQNPLNFVNNFSEVSKELLEEMLDDLKKGDMEEVDAIASDVIANLEKILHHGKRADGIVKGMLQHSRSNSGKKELTDINLLVDEYLRLAYHGLRAKDKSFNASLETDFDDSIEQQEFIAQDIGRVVLNLITNAFYACNQKKNIQDNSEAKSFQPTVSVSTKNLKDHIEITIEDNGNGIPKPIIDKIFQPFFTTKPTGEGTGLGLSLSYDIIKAHGGTLNVESEEGKGTRFTVNLPVNS